MYPWFKFYFLSFNIVIVYYYTPKNAVIVRKISTELFLFLVHKGTNPYYQRQFYASN